MSEKRKKVAVYLRVSTDEQSVDSQRGELLETIERRGWELWSVREDQASGARVSREGLDLLMKDVRTGKVDVVLCYKLDRLGRSLAHLMQIVEELIRHRVALVVPGQGVDTSEDNPAGRLQLHMLAAVAEFERSMIRDRVKAGMKAAKARGVHCGRPRGIKGNGKKRRRVAGVWAENPNWSCRKVATAAGVSVALAWEVKGEVYPKEPEPAESV